MYELKAIKFTRSGMEGTSIEVRAESHRELISKMRASAERHGIKITEHLAATGPAGLLMEDSEVVGRWEVVRVDEMAGV